MIMKSSLKMGFRSDLYRTVLNSFSRQVLFVSQLPTLEIKGRRKYWSKQIRVTTETLRACSLFNFCAQLDRGVWPRDSP